MRKLILLLWLVPCFGQGPQDSHDAHKIWNRLITSAAPADTNTLCWDATAKRIKWCAAGSGTGDALTTNPLSQFAATTSLQLKGVISDETGSGALVFATSPTLVTPALGTPASGVVTNLTGTLTNIVYNVESTGNIFTSPSPIMLPAGGCQNTTASSFWDLPTSTPAVATCVTGTNIQKGVLAFADTSGGFSAQTTFPLPGDWITGTLPDVDLYWTTSATSGNAKWTVQFVCTDVAASATDDPAFPTSSSGFNTVTTAAPGTANRVQTSTITSATVPASCVTATKELLHIRVFRDGNDAADTIGATANLVGVALTVRRAM